MPKGVIPMSGRTAKPRFFVLLSVIAAMVFVAGIAAVRVRMDRDAELLQQIRMEQQALVDEIGELEREIEYVQTDEYIENAAREELGLIMPGEIRYMNGGN